MDPLSPDQPAQPALPIGLFTRLRRRLGATFALTVLLPTVLAAVYFGLIASDVYISEARFVVRSPARAQATGLGALLGGTAFSKSSDDTYLVHHFALSRDALRELDDKLQVKAAFSSPAIDRFNRFPGFDLDDSFEAFHAHYLKHVQIDYDPGASISVLRVSAYTADDARRINELLLQMGERLVNTLNQRGQQDLLASAKAEVALAEDKVRATALALSAFRSDRSVFDPTGESALRLQAVARLQEELLSAQAQLTEVKRLSPDNPQLASLATRVDGLRKAVAAETAQVTGGTGSLSAKAPAYDRLVLDKGFADKQLASAMTALETARLDAQRKQLYLERLVQPSLPDESMEPRRVRSVFTVFLLGLVAWGVLSLILAGVREHVD